MGIHTQLNPLVTAILEAQTVEVNSGDRFKELKPC